ncbi:hypothetical protein BDY24DRAFT_374215 [Mrakia frigida]|uniref:uncharacterized protein n=1 Tax=Mrakia frigida TaxID=29902 RepID=UPI003FCC05F8
MLFNLTATILLVLSVLSLGVDAKLETGVGGRIVRKQVTNQMPAELAVKSDGSGIQAFNKRVMAEEIPSKSGPGGEAIPFKRQVAEETPSFNDGTGIKPFKRTNSTPVQQLAARQLNSVPAEAATKSLNGQIVPFERRNPAPIVRTGLAARQLNSVPAEAATKSLNGQIVPFSNKRSEKRQNDIAVDAEDTNLVPAERPIKGGDGFGGVIEL